MKIKLKKSVEESSNILWSLIIVVVFFIILYASLLYISKKYCSDQISFWDKTKCVVSLVIDNLAFAINSIIHGGERWVESQIDYATGGLYASSVDKYENEKIGIEIGKLEVNNKYTTDMDVTYTSYITANTITSAVSDGYQPYTMNVDVSCFYYPKNEKEKMIETDKRTLVMYKGGKYIHCNLGKLDRGNYWVGIKAKFNTVGFGKRLVCFIDENALDDLLRTERIDSKEEAIDFYGFGGFSSDIDKSKRSGGYLDPALKLDDSPIPITSGTQLMIGMSLRNTETSKGKIKKINNIALSLPNGIKLKQTTGNYYTIASTRNVERSTIYDITMPGEIENYATINNIFTVTNPQTLLTYEDGSLKDFKCVYISVRVDYDYEVHKKTAIGVTKPLQIKS